MLGPDLTPADITDEQGFERSWNKAETVIQVALGCVVAGGLLGLFGDGPLSGATAPIPGAEGSVRYERILRRSAASDITLTVTQRVSQLTVTLDQALAPDIGTVTPRPERIGSAPQGVSYVFDVTPGDDARVTFALKSSTAGILQRHVTVLEQDVAFTQIVLP